jgi:predicted 3-demethylubiquinone-9 3-methyltransferase (glyoxalase superfamily)
MQYPVQILKVVLFCNYLLTIKNNRMATMQKITSNLWFDTQAEEAAKYYVSIFKNSKMGRISRYGKEGYEIHQRPAGSVMTVEFTLEGQTFIALNGGPHFKFNEAISFIVNCETQEEIDYYWNKLSEGGDKNAQQCGWLKDKYGLSWQIVPTIIDDMITDPNSKKSEAVMRALLKMKKLDIKKLEEAYNQEAVLS